MHNSGPPPGVNPPGYSHKVIDASTHCILAVRDDAKPPLLTVLSFVGVMAVYE